MELKFEVRLFVGDTLTKISDSTTPLVDLGVLTDEEYWTIMDIAARNGYWVLTKPVVVAPEVQTYG
jgi:hypothetical protein